MPSGVTHSRLSLFQLMVCRMKSISVFECVDKDPAWKLTKYNTIGWLEDVRSDHFARFLSATGGRPPFADVWTAWRGRADWPWDRFDVYGLGLAVLQLALASPVHPDLDGLLADMLHWDPSARATIEAATARFEAICAEVPSPQAWTPTP